MAKVTSIAEVMGIDWKLWVQCWNLLNGVKINPDTGEVAYLTDKAINTISILMDRPDGDKYDLDVDKLADDVSTLAKAYYLKHPECWEELNKKESLLGLLFIFYLIKEENKMFLKCLLIYMLVGIISAFLLVGVQIKICHSKEERQKFYDDNKKWHDWTDNLVEDQQECTGISRPMFMLIGLLCYAFFWPIAIPKAIILRDQIRKS